MTNMDNHFEICGYLLVIGLSSVDAYHQIKLIIYSACTGLVNKLGGCEYSPITPSASSAPSFSPQTHGIREPIQDQCWFMISDNGPI